MSEEHIGLFIETLFNSRGFVILVLFFLIIVVFPNSLWMSMLPKVCRLFKLNRNSTDKQSGERNPSKNTAFRKYSNTLPTVLEADRQGMSYRNVLSELDHAQISRYMDDSEGDPLLRRSESRPAPHWLDGPRDSSVLPDIIDSTYSDYNEEADYAMKQMLAILETLNPVEDFVDLFDKSLKAIEFRLPFTIIKNEEGKADWKAMRHKLVSDIVPLSPGEDEGRGLSPAQMSAVFDALPFLFDTVACHDQLKQFQDPLSMLVMIAMSGNSMIRRQCISAITVLMERALLSQEFMREGVVPGLFFIYQSGVGTFQSNDLRMECVQALCQVISFDTIHDRRWLFENFLPSFSQMLKDPTMHVRKSALHIFGNLGNLFGQKFTEVFLVPHLITLSCDMTWAVRKVACEIFVKVAECASNEVRVDILSPNFVRLLNDPNKWVSFIAYQQLGPFISLFADPNITGIELKDGQIILREVTAPADVSSSFNTTVSDGGSHEFGDLPQDTWLPEIDPNDDFEYRLTLNEHVAPRPATESVSAAVKTPKRGERVMDSVLSGINKMFSPFDRSSPKSNAPKEIEKVSSTFSSPGKRTLSLHSAVSLMDKWSKRSNPNNPQRFPIFDSSADASTDSKQAGSEVNGGTGIAAKCSSTDDLTKLGLDDDASSVASPQKHAEQSPEKRTSSPRGRRIATNAWSKLDIRQKLFLRRLGALPPSGSKRSPKLSPKLSPSRSPIRNSRKKKGLVFDFAAPTEIRSMGLMTPPMFVEDDNKLNTVDRELYMENQTPKFNDDENEALDSDEEDGLDKSFVADEEEDEEDTPLSMEIKSSVSESVSVSASIQNISQEPVSNEFSLTYWSSNYAIASIDDELKPFGSSSSLTNSPTSNNYLESRFDVMKPASTSPRARSSSFVSNGSPVTASPRKKANSSSESSPTSSSVDSSKSSDSVAMINTEEREKLGILDIEEMNMSISSNSSIHGEAAMTEESDISLTSIEHEVFRHVPVDLVESYMKVMGPISHNGGAVATGDASLCAEIYRHCAHNFPAVCYTLGRAAWPRLKLVFRKLALDEQARVRQSISYSIHEIATMLGTEITDEDLLPVFYDLRNDQNADVRNGILLHLFDFVKCLSLEKREEIIFSLPQFFPIGAQPGNQAQNGDWRSRFELISQLSKLCSLYNIQDINLHISGIALTLADDRVAEVRREAVILVSTIVGALVSVEWAQIKESRDIEKGHLDAKSKKEKAESFLSEQFVDDIVSSFAKTQKWTRRQTFCFISAQILRDKQCDGVQFRYFFATPLQQLVQDKVPNVRIASCEALDTWKNILLSESTDKKPSDPSNVHRDIDLLASMMSTLSKDLDIDAAYFAKKCQGLANDSQPVDLKSRTQRMREREQSFFGDVILTDTTGSIVRVVDKEVKQVIKRGIADEMKDIEELIAKEAPIQKMEEFEDEPMNQSEEEDIAKPPEMLAVAVRVEEGEDNTDVVDMEIDEVEEAAPTISVVVPSTGEEEADIPMDPTPSTPEKPSESEETSTECTDA
ncbi:unnamed protein product [Caenorhabditis sp. 36 PRJEB53466]|nr:unnamed protein product [Caenorhabditis sp. 36 PRJEB53466]